MRGIIQTRAKITEITSKLRFYFRVELSIHCLHGAANVLLRNFLEQEWIDRKT